MNAGKMLKTALGLLKCKFLNKKVPLVVGWAITDRCNRKCAYCDIWRRPPRDMSTADVLSVVDELAEAGTLAISFTGGEPLMREDMGKIIDYVHARGVETKINSNGSLVKNRIEDLKHLDRLHLSLEGPPEIHDAIRGEGAYKEIEEAVEAAASNGIKINFATVLTKTNLASVDFLVKQARQNHCQVIFQPATQKRLGGDDPNELVPEKRAYQAVIEDLMHRKKKGETAIGNSMACLRHLYCWPDAKRIRCASGRISCRIEPEGSVLYCSREEFSFSPKNCRTAPFEEAFKHLQPVNCRHCWCAGRIELSLAADLKPGVLFEQMRSIIR